MSEFKVGDRVRIVRTDCEFLEGTIGKFGYIVRVNTNDYDVDIPGDRKWCYDSHELERLDPPGGMKFDDEKPRWDLLPLDTVEEFVKVLTKGAEKYDDNNWKKVEGRRYFSALLRHLKDHQRGEKNDPETGLSHLAHAGSNLIFLLWKEMNNEL